MSKVILRCCENQSKFLVTYDLDSQYYVCAKCIILEHWKRGIKKINKISFYPRIKSCLDNNSEGESC